MDGEVLGTLLRSETAGNFLLHLHHEPVLFGLIVGEGNARMVEESHHILFAAIEAIKQIVTDPEFFATAPFGCAFGGAGVMQGSESVTSARQWRYLHSHQRI